MKTIVSFKKLTALAWIRVVNSLFLTSRIYNFMIAFLICFSDASSRSPNGPSISLILLSLAMSTSSERKFLLDMTSKRAMLPNLHPLRFKNFRSFRYVLWAN